MCVITFTVFEDVHDDGSCRAAVQSGLLHELFSWVQLLCNLLGDEWALPSFHVLLSERIFHKVLEQELLLPPQTANESISMFCKVYSKGSCGLKIIFSAEYDRGKP